jgi:hypothetical protein
MQKLKEACPGGAGSCKMPVEGAEVRVFDRNDPTFRVTYGIKNLGSGIYDQVFWNDIGRVGACTTDASGFCIAGEEAVGDFLVIVKYTDGDLGTVYTGKPKSPEDFVGGLASKEFQVIKVYKEDGSIQLSGGSKTVLSGSYLEIIPRTMRCGRKGQMITSIPSYSPRIRTGTWICAPMCPSDTPSWGSTTRTGI